MSSQKSTPTWKAQPHTIAKIKILEAYLKAWFPILGKTRRAQELLYIDGFAGPGEYTNHRDASPIVACRAAISATSMSDWRAGVLHCAFIEPDTEAFNHLKKRLEAFSSTKRMRIHTLNTSFAEGVQQLRKEIPQPFQDSNPLFVFVDPFGAKGVKFGHVADILRSSTSEMLLNFDADGIARIFRAGRSANADSLLTDIYGDDSWKSLGAISKFESLCREAMNLYKAKLRTLPGVNYVFAFEMRSKSGALNYFLVFASKHYLGLEKMKEAMRSLDQTGGYVFSDANVGQTALFRWDDPELYAPKLFDVFRGASVNYQDVRDYALNETPFPNPKRMLKLLESQERISVESVDPARRRGSFPEEKIRLIHFQT